MSDTAARAAELRRWILDKAGDLRDSELTDHTPLFERRHLRSVHIPELLMVLERLRGSSIEVDELGPGDFRDIATLRRRFLGSGTPS